MRISDTAIVPEGQHEVKAKAFFYVINYIFIPQGNNGHCHPPHVLGVAKVFPLLAHTFNL